MRYEFHPEALGEYDEAGHYYARQKPGLDLQFEPDYVLIVAVAHCSREPGYWKHRIR